MGLFGGPNVEKLKAKGDVERLVEALGHKDAGVRRAAAEALGQIRNSHSVEPLVTALGDADENVEAAAATALGQIGDPRAVKPLIDRLAYANPIMEVAATEALVNLGTHAVEPLVAALGSWSMLTRAGVARALGRIGDPCAVEPLIVALGSWDAPHKKSALDSFQEGKAREAATDALARLGAVAVEPLVAALRSDDSSTRLAAASALETIGPPAVEPLVQVLRDKSSPRRREAAQLLDKMGWEPQDEGQRAVALVGRNDWTAAVALGAPSVEPLIKVLRDRSSPWRRDAAQALGEIGDARAIGPLVSALGEVEESGLGGVFGKLSVRGAAARALGAIGDPRAVESLLAAHADANESVRKDAVEALGRIRDPRAVEPLVGALTDADEGVRRAAVEALEKMGWEPQDAGQRVLWLLGHEEGVSAVAAFGAPGVEPLLAALQSEEGWLRRDAALALGQIGDPRAVGPLLSVLRHPDSVSRWAAAQALGELGESRAVEPLVAALEDAEHDVQRAAAEALSRIGDARAVESLMDLATDSQRPWRGGSAALEAILERAAAELPVETLHRLAATRFLRAVHYEAAPECPSFDRWEVVDDDSSRVVQLARQELIRRGLQA